MDRWNRNKEGYADSTAGIAIRRVLREEKKIIMGRKRNCRRTTEYIGGRVEKAGDKDA